MSNIKIIENYLEDVISDILENKENHRFIAWKVHVLINKIQEWDKLESKQSSKTTTKKVKIIENNLTDKTEYFI